MFLGRRFVTVFADPGQYLYHSCEQIAALRITSVERAQELKLLMDKAEHSTGGAVVNVIAYKGEYVSAIEEIKVLDARHGEKNAIPRWLPLSPPQGEKKAGQHGGDLQNTAGDSGRPRGGCRADSGA